MKLLGLMRGASLISGGGSPQHAALVAAYRADPAARQALDSDEDPGALLERLRREPSATGRALDDYLEFAGYRLLDGFDISNHYALELPDVLLRSIRSAIDETGVASDVEQEIADVRSHVPEEHREEYDALLADARVGYSVRDERGVYSDIWASGLMRRAALAAGRRLAARGRLHDAADIVFADIDEMCALLEGASAPTADELAARHAYHRTYTAKDAPVHLGDDPPPMPDPSALPPPMARLMAALGTAMGEMFGVSDVAHEETVIRGLGASSGTREGIVRRVAGADATSTGSSRATCCSPRPPPRPSTSCCRCSARSSPTAAAPCRTRRSSRGSTASPASSAPATPPCGSPTAPASGSTVTRAR